MTQHFVWTYPVGESHKQSARVDGWTLMAHPSALHHDRWSCIVGGEHEGKSVCLSVDGFASMGEAKAVASHMQRAYVAGEMDAPPRAN